LDGKEQCTIFAIPNLVLAKQIRGVENGATLGDLKEEDLHNVLKIHTYSDYLPSTYMLTAPNIPVLLAPPTLNGVLVINSKCIAEKEFLLHHTVHTIATDWLCCNGVIHTVNGVMLPPPTSLSTVSLLPPTEFSTFQTAHATTGLATELAETSQKGGIIFIPTNAAFTTLGSSANNFLFSGTVESLKYLTVLLKYHIVRNETFYSNIHYKNPALSYDYEHKKLVGEEAKKHALRHISGVRRRCVTSWLGPLVIIDLKRDGGKIDIKINGTAIEARDGNASDGVVHALGGVLVPPPKDGEDDWDEKEWDKREWQVEELTKRLGSWL
jgi:uncharacterized surface protein with fasciclin (FAS1) repeats